MTAAYDILIFGGTGDLATRKLMPALFRCELEEKFGDQVVIYCVSRDLDGDDAALRQHVHAGLVRYMGDGAVPEAVWQRFAARLRLHTLEIAEPDPRWQALAARLQPAAASIRIFYLAVSPRLYQAACRNLDAAGMISEQARIVLEKPLGQNFETAHVINQTVDRYFGEERIYRIDHYLGKETVQNLLAVRFTNTLFEQMWNGHSVDHVQITLAETVGVEGRADFYEQTGALRDMVQNHMLQLLCLVAMEPPQRMTAADIRMEKSKVLRALRPIAGADVARDTVRGQYAAGSIDGERVHGYVDELGRDSRVETFVAIRAHIDNWRWARTPFYLRTGKRLGRRYAEIVVQFRPLSHLAYPADAGALECNRLVIRLQPEESMQLVIMSKDLDQTEFRLKPMALNLNFSESAGGKPGKSDGYQRLLLDVMAGNQTLFAHRDEVEQAWRWLDPIVDAWSNSSDPPLLYRAGSFGPPAADELMRNDGRSWLQP